jgi:hypothetical protein
VSAAFLIFPLLLVARFVLVAVVVLVALATKTPSRRRAALAVLQLLLVRHRPFARGSAIDPGAGSADG